MIRRRMPSAIPCTLYRARRFVIESRCVKYMSVTTQRVLSHRLESPRDSRGSRIHHGCRMSRDSRTQNDQCLRPVCPPSTRVRVLGLVGVNIFEYAQIRLAATHRLHRSNDVSAASGVRATCLCSAMDHRRFPNEEALIQSRSLHAKAGRESVKQQQTEML